jgi:hypothetical protein
VLLMFLVFCVVFLFRLSSSILCCPSVFNRIGGVLVACSPRVW